MRRYLTQKLVNECTRYSTDFNLLYLNNNKVACTTIKYSIWAAADQLNQRQTFRGRIHRREGDPFVKDIFDGSTFDTQAFARADKFSVVRNPFVRILSGYLQKVAKDHRVWNPFRRRFGIRPEVTQNELLFRDFLNIIASEPDELLNGHFRPQYANLLIPFTTLGFVGQLEDPGRFAGFLSEFGITIQEVRRNPTNAKGALSDYYDEDCIELVREKFSDDFQLFGYSQDLRDAEDFVPVVPAKPDNDLLADWVLTGQPPTQAFDQGGQTFHAFSIAKTTDQKLDCIRSAFPVEDNWSRLQAYDRFACEFADQRLQDQIRDRLKLLRNSHRALVKNSDIFEPMPS